MSPNTARQAPGRTLLILGFGTLAFVLAQTTVIPALGDLQRELGASTSGIAWMITAYLLVASIATPIFGRLGDMFGKQRLLAISLALFAGLDRRRLGRLAPAHDRRARPAGARRRRLPALLRDHP
jgi:MFS family permease